MIYNMFHICKVRIFSDTHSGAIGESFRENLLIKSLNQNIFEKFKLNRNLQTTLINMMYNMSMLRYRFSNEQWGEGAALNHLPLLFCKSVYCCIKVHILFTPTREYMRNSKHLTY